MESSVFNLGPLQKTKLRKHLENQSFEFSQPPYTDYSAKKKGISVTVYLSGKCVIQGKEAGEFIEFYMEPEILGTFQSTYPKQSALQALLTDLDRNPLMGVDESGKGDFFGPLVIAGVYADIKGIEKLLDIGVKDSKTLTDKSIHQLANQIRKTCPHQIVILNPLKYNEVYAGFKNLNAMLAWGHATVLESLHERTGCKTALIDQFANEKVVQQALKRKKIDLDLTQRTKGESNPIVAAASILARDTFVQRLAALSQEAGMILPKGASSQVIAAGKRLVQTLGLEALPNFAKMHFKTLDRLN